jgi:multidrug efflux pump
MAPEADAHSLGEGLASALGKIRTQLPAGVQVHQVADQARVVQHATGQFMQALLEALAIVLAVGFLSLGWRAGLVVAFSIPLVLAGTFVLMKAFGIDLQRVSIGALIIAIGLLVDDAMIAVEMMKVKLEQGWSRAQAATYAYRSTAFPMLTGTLVTAAAFLPVGLAKSSAGEYTFSICAVVTISLLVSWLVAVIFTPLIGYHLLQEHTDHKERLYRNRFYTTIKNLVAACIAWRKSVIAASLAAFVLAVAGFTKVEQQFFPPSDRPELLVDVWLPEGSTFAANEAVTEKLEQVLAKESGIEYYVSYVGGSSPRFYLPLDLQLPAVNYTQIVITPRRLEAREEVLKRLRQTIDHDFPGSGIRISRLENGPPVGYPIQFRVRGDDPDKTRQIAADVMRVVKQNRFARNVSQDSDEPVNALRIEVNQDKARQLGITSQGLSRQLQTLLSGRTATYYLEDGKRIGVVIRASEGDRRSMEFLSQLKVFAPDGTMVPLTSVAHISHAQEQGIIWRMDLQPVVTVRADLPDNVQAPEVSAEIDRNLGEIRNSLPKGYRIEAGGAMEENDKATDSVLAVLPLTAFVILTLLMLQLRSFSKLVLVLLTAPLGVIGVTAALLPFRVPFGFVAMLGMISLAGMIMRNSVILIDQIKQDMALGLSRYDAIIDSTVRRTRPILLTAAAAILAMIPLSTSVFWGPMAIVIMGGLFVATLLTLVTLPALYAAWFRVQPE